METNKNDIIKGFNDGYLLRKHDPLLAEKLYKGFLKKESNYQLGFIKGFVEYQKELIKGKSRNYEPSKSKSILSKTKFKNKDVSKDK